MICAHEPGLDPRIRWEAEAAAPRFDVTVLGFERDHEGLAHSEVMDGYRVDRLTRPSLSGIYYLWRLKDAVPPSGFLAFVALLALASPLLVLGEIIGRLLRGALRAASRRSSLSEQPTAGRFTTRIWGMRRLGPMRIEYVLAVLRAQFAPATSAFWNYLRIMPEKPDTVHCNDLDTLLVGVLAKQRFGCRLVYDAHEFYPVSDPHGRWIDIAFFSWIEALLIRRADAVVTVNPPLGEVIRAAYGLDRVYSVPNAEPWIEGRQISMPASEMDRLAQGRVKFLFQGRFAADRGIEDLIKGWCWVDSARAALFLRGPDSIWRDAAIQLTSRLGLLGRGVYFLDAVSEDRLVSGAAEADVGIIPYKPVIINDRLSCPNKLSQYLHAGLMVLSNDLPYVKSVLTEAGAGLFYTSAELSTLAAAVGQILDNPELLRRGRDNAWRFARECFNWQAQGEVLLSIYKGADNPQHEATVLARSASHASAA
jgi:glycosyltransferase involved in cell wall biosynthesis